VPTSSIVYTLQYIFTHSISHLLLGYPNSTDNTTFHYPISKTTTTETLKQNTNNFFQQGINFGPTNGAQEHVVLNHFGKVNNGMARGGGGGSTVAGLNANGIACGGGGSVAGLNANGIACGGGGSVAGLNANGSVAGLNANGIACGGGGSVAGLNANGSLAGLNANGIACGGGGSVAGLNANGSVAGLNANGIACGGGGSVAAGIDFGKMVRGDHSQGGQTYKSVARGKGKQHPSNFSNRLNPFWTPLSTLNTHILSNGSSRDGQIGSSYGPRRRGPRRSRQICYFDPYRRCTNLNCNTRNTPMWRSGPLGPKVTPLISKSCLYNKALYSIVECNYMFLGTQ